MVRITVYRIDDSDKPRRVYDADRFHHLDFFRFNVTGSTKVGRMTSKIAGDFGIPRDRQNYYGIKWVPDRYGDECYRMDELGSLGGGDGDDVNLRNTLRSLQLCGFINRTTSRVGGRPLLAIAVSALPEDDATNTTEDKDDEPQMVREFDAVEERIAAGRENAIEISDSGSDDDNKEGDTDEDDEEEDGSVSSSGSEDDDGEEGDGTDDDEQEEDGSDDNEQGMDRTIEAVMERTGPGQANELENVRVRVRLATSESAEMDEDGVGSGREPRRKKPRRADEGNRGAVDGPSGKAGSDDDDARDRGSRAAVQPEGRSDEGSEEADENERSAANGTAANDDDSRVPARENERVASASTAAVAPRHQRGPDIDAVPGPGGETRREDASLGERTPVIHGIGAQRREEASRDDDIDAARDVAAVPTEDNGTARAGVVAATAAYGGTSELRQWLRGLDADIRSGDGRFERYAPAFEREFGCLADVALAADVFPGGVDAIFQACNIVPLGDKARIKWSVAELQRPQRAP